MLADGDFKTVYLLDEQRESLQRECLNFEFGLKVFSLTEDKFVKLKDWQGNGVILYTRHGQVFHPKCKPVEQIKLVNTTICYEDVPIMFYQGNTWSTGFLTSDSVIRTYSKPRVCDDTVKFIRLANSTQHIALSRNKVKLVEAKNINYDKIKFFNNMAFRNLSHMSVITAGIDIISKMQNLTMVNEIDGTWLTLDHEESTSKTFFAGLDGILDSFGAKLKLILAICIISLILYALIRTQCFSSCCCALKDKCCLPFFNRCKTSSTKLVNRINLTRREKRKKGNIVKFHRDSQQGDLIELEDRLNTSNMETTRPRTSQLEVTTSLPDLQRSKRKRPETEDTTSSTDVARTQRSKSIVTMEEVQNLFK